MKQKKGTFWDICRRSSVVSADSGGRAPSRTVHRQNIQYTTLSEQLYVIREPTYSLEPEVWSRQKTTAPCEASYLMPLFAQSVEKHTDGCSFKKH